MAEQAAVAETAADEMAVAEEEAAVKAAAEEAAADEVRAKKVKAEKAKAENGRGKKAKAKRPAAEKAEAGRVEAERLAAEATASAAKAAEEAAGAAVAAKAAEDETAVAARAGAIKAKVPTSMSKEAVVDELGQRLSHALNASLASLPDGPPFKQMASHLRAHATRPVDTLPVAIEGAVLRPELSTYLERHAVLEMLGALALDLLRDPVCWANVCKSASDCRASVQRAVEFAARHLEAL